MNHNLLFSACQNCLAAIRKLEVRNTSIAYVTFVAQLRRIFLCRCESTRVYLERVYGVRDEMVSNANTGLGNWLLYRARNWVLLGEHPLSRAT